MNRDNISSLANLHIGLQSVYERMENCAMTGNLGPKWSCPGGFEVDDVDEQHL